MLLIVLLEGIADIDDVEAVKGNVAELLLILVGDDIADVEAVKGNAVSGEENAAELLLIVLLEGIAVGGDIDDVEAVKGNAAQLLLILLLAVGEGIDDIEAVKRDAVCDEENTAQLLPK